MGVKGFEYDAAGTPTLLTVTTAGNFTTITPEFQAGIVTLGTGTDSVVAGEGADTQAINCIVLGKDASVGNSAHTGSIVIGKDASTGGANNIVIGEDASSNGATNVLIGTNVSATGSDNVVVGIDSKAEGDDNVVIGDTSVAHFHAPGNTDDALTNVLIGQSVDTYGNQNVAIGDSVTVGATSSNSSSKNVTIGQSCSHGADSSSNVLIGFSSTLGSGDTSVIVGNNCTGGNFDSTILIGSNLSATKNNEVKIGGASSLYNLAGKMDADLQFADNIAATFGSTETHHIESNGTDLLIQRVSGSGVTKIDHELQVTDQIDIDVNSTSPALYIDQDNTAGGWFQFYDGGTQKVRCEINTGIPGFFAGGTSERFYFSADDPLDAATTAWTLYGGNSGTGAGQIDSVCNTFVISGVKGLLDWPNMMRLTYEDDHCFYNHMTSAPTNSVFYFRNSDLAGTPSGTTSGNVFQVDNVISSTLTALFEIDWEGSVTIEKDLQVDGQVVNTDLSASSNTFPALNPVISIYDNAGGQTFTGTAITINLDTTKKNSDGTIYSLASDVITIAETGTYLFNIDVSIDVSTGTARSVSRAWLEEDPLGGGSFAEVDGTRMFMYNRAATAGEQTGSCTICLDVTATDEFRLRAIRHAGSDTLQTIADGTRLTIMKLSV